MCYFLISFCGFVSCTLGNILYICYFTEYITYKTGKYILSLENIKKKTKQNFLKEKLYYTVYQNHSFLGIEVHLKIFSKQHTTKYFLTYNE